MNKAIKILLAASAVTASVYAQTGSNSPYSMYGLGVLQDNATGFNRGMNGVGYAYSAGNQLNTLNPASYAKIDSLSFIFDVGMSLQQSAFTENGKTIYAKNANFEYVAAALRVHKHLGVSFGVLPVTTVGYSFSVKDATISDYTNSYSGSGGLHKVYLGTGWEPLKGLSVGANVAYVWGVIERSVSSIPTQTSYNYQTRAYNVNIGTYDVQLGAQYSLNLSKTDKVSIGATYTIGHNTNRSEFCQLTSQNTALSTTHTTEYSQPDAYELPTIIGVGLGYNGKHNLFVGADYQLQKWGGMKMPMFQNANNGNQAGYVMRDGMYQDRSRINIGASLLPNPVSRSIFGRTRYSAGIGYASPYLKINGHDGPKEYSATIGLGIPVTNAWNNRSMLNISAQWSRAEAKNLITDTTWRINVGITFNERWFMKWKVE